VTFVTVVCLLIFCVAFCPHFLSFITSFGRVRVDLIVGVLCGVCQQLFLCWFSMWRLSTVVCLLVFCVTFVHSCLSVGFLCGVCPELFVCWFLVWRLSTVVCWFSVFTVVCLLSSLSVGFVSA
jgi:hypothetical protein